MARTRPNPPSAPPGTYQTGNEISLGWRLVIIAAAAGLVVQLCSAGVSITSSEPALVPAIALMQGGHVILRGSVAFGAWQRARWSAWAGAFLYGANLILAPVAVFATISLPGGELRAADLQAAIFLAVCQAVASLLFLVGLVLHRRR